MPEGAFGESVVASRALIRRVTNLESLNRPEIVIASRRFSQASKVALETFPDAEHRHFESHAWAIEVILLGEAHAAVAPEPHPRLWSLENSEGLYMPFGEQTLNGGLNAIAVRLGDRKLLEYLNKWILARKQDGWLSERFRYWFRSTEWYGAGARYAAHAPALSDNAVLRRRQGNQPGGHPAQPIEAVGPPG